MWSGVWDIFPATCAFVSTPGGFSQANMPSLGNLLAHPDLVISEKVKQDAEQAVISSKQDCQIKQRNTAVVCPRSAPRDRTDY